MRNKLTDLNDYLFEELEILMDDSLTQEELEKQIKIGKVCMMKTKNI